jgi:mannosyltransferase OCH1-like enzyme
LYQFGGLYVDLDIMPVKNVSKDLSITQGHIYLVRSANTPQNFTNAIMASDTSESARRFWTSMFEHVNGFPNTISEIACSTIRHLEIMMSTGPLALTEVSQTSKEVVTVLPSQLWNPYDLEVAGSMEHQTNQDSLVKILKGSSWHNFDSSIISFVHVHKKWLIAFALLLSLLYIVNSELLYDKFEFLRRQKKNL